VREVRIGVVSDTHLTARGNLPEQLVEGLQGVDLILHAGDWVAPEVADLLGLIAPVDGVYGNNDGWDIMDRFGREKIIRVAGKSIGLIHGDGGRLSTVETAWSAFRGRQVDMIIFGHSHAPHHEVREGVLLFNPGSPTQKRRQPHYSYGIVNIGPDGISAEHRFF